MMMTTKTVPRMEMHGSHSAGLLNRYFSLDNAHTQKTPIIPATPESPVAALVLEAHLTRYGGLMTRVCLVNATLQHHGRDSAYPTEIARTATAQLVTLQAMARRKNPAGTRAALSQFLATLAQLQDAYRDIRAIPNLPEDVSSSIGSVLRSMDAAVAQTMIL
ncbi:MAG: hypothetical protein GYA23_08725 [Methanomicrobiales archaeon]|nr:hypothetical protein [Methanomicrobiales archaeon]